MELLDCVGPTLKHPAGEVDRGETLTITGEYFGTNCYDTGPPPPGEGVLGRPATGIEVMFVQGETEIVVAAGNADQDLKLSVEVVVPATLQPGDVTVVARTDTGARTFDDPGKPMTVSGAPAPVEASVDVASFGPPRPSDSEAESITPVWLIAVAALVAAAVVTSLALGVLRFTRR